MERSMPPQLVKNQLSAFDWFSSITQSLSSISTHSKNISHMSKVEPHLQVFTSAHEHIGHFDGECFYTNIDVNLRVDNDEVYTRTLPSRLVGYFKNHQIELLDGSIPYYLKT